MSAPRTADGRRRAFSICCSAPCSASTHHDWNGAGASRSTKATASGRRGGDELLGDLGEVGVARVRAGSATTLPQLGQRLVPPEPLDRLRQRVQRHAEERPRLEADRTQIVSADPRHAGLSRPALHF